MTDVFITIDTELSSGAYRSGWGADYAENFARTIACTAVGGERSSGIFRQMDIMNEYGVRGVFFIDPMASLAFGQRAVDDIVHPVLAAGHEVQLHCHTEWLELVPGNPLRIGTGGNVKDFTMQQQADMLGWCAERLVATGAPFPAAFRAGNYGANDDTLRALAQLGIGIDSSFASALTQPCEIGLEAGQCEPQFHHGVLEMPIASLCTRGGGLRHAQITSISSGEMIAAMDHAATARWAAFVIVSHSFEFFNRTDRKVNPIVLRRFEAICRHLSENRTWLRTPSLQSWQAPVGNTPDYRPLPHRLDRTLYRMAEQAAANALYA